MIGKRFELTNIGLQHNKLQSKVNQSDNYRRQSTSLCRMCMNDEMMKMMENLLEELEEYSIQFINGQSSTH